MLSQDQFATPENTDFSASDKKLKKDLEARLEEEGHLILSQFLDKFNIQKDLENAIVPYHEDVRVDGKGIQLLYGQLKGNGAVRQRRGQLRGVGAVRQLRGRPHCH